MKKKFVALLATVLAVCCALCLAACDTTGNDVIEITEITLNQTELTLTEGDEEFLVADFSPFNATDITMEWSSSDPRVATVEYGSVTAIAAGETTITVMANNGITATCAVTVTAKMPEQYVVTFNATGGKFDNDASTYTVKINDGEKLTDVTVTRGERYTFTGWYKDEYRTELWNSDEDTVTQNTQLYAGWKYTSRYQTVIDALAQRIKTERMNNSLKVEIISVFTDNGYLCFIEKDDTGVFSYSTGICNFDGIIDNEGLISEIPSTTLTQLKDYNYEYTTDNEPSVAEYMAFKYSYWYDDSTTEDSMTYSVIFSCVSEWEVDTEHFLTNGPYYSCKIKAILADENGRVFDYGVTVVSGFNNFNAVIGGMALSETFDATMTALGETADDFYSEQIKELDA